MFSNYLINNNIESIRFKKISIISVISLFFFSFYVIGLGLGPFLNYLKEKKSKLIEINRITSILSIYNIKYNSLKIKKA